MDNYINAKEAALQSGILPPSEDESKLKALASTYPTTLKYIFRAIDSSSKEGNTKIQVEDIDDLITSEDYSYLDDLRNIEHDSSNAFHRMKNRTSSKDVETVEKINDTVTTLYQSLMSDAVKDIAHFLEYKGYKITVYTDKYYGLDIEWGI